MHNEAADRKAEIAHLIKLGDNVISFITGSIEILNRTYFAIQLSNDAKSLAWATETVLSPISAPANYLKVIGQVRELGATITQKIEENPGCLELPEEGFPLLHATQLIGIWGALESFVGDVFKSSIKYRPELLEDKVFERISLPVGLLASGSDELYATIYQRFLPPGTGHIGKLEDALNAVGLGGPIDRELKKKLRSAHQIRNLWAHNAGVVDAHFMKECPYLEYKLNDVVELSVKEYSSLTQAVVDYVSLILDRINTRGF